MIEESLIALISLVWMVREYQNFRERKDLLGRIMARDYTEFMVWERQKKPKSDKMAPERISL